MALRKGSRRGVARRVEDIKLRRKPATHHAPKHRQHASADEPHAALLRDLATLKDPIITGSLPDHVAVQESLLVAACRSAALIVVLLRPDLARQPEQLRQEASRLLELIDGPET